MESDPHQNMFESDRKLLEILRIMREQGQSRVTTIAEELEVAKSTVHSHLAALVAYGFVEKNENEYQIGLRFLEYGIHARNRKILYEAAKEIIGELAEESGENVWCVTESNGHAVYLDGAAGEHAVQTHESIGDHTQLHHIAAGKAILAFLPEDRIAEILAGAELESYTENTITEREKLLDELARIREEGVAYNIEESLEGLHAVAAPIRKDDGHVYGSISIGGPRQRLTEELLKSEYKSMLLGVSNEIEINIRHM